jgi:hypothetical protein
MTVLLGVVVGGPMIRVSVGKELESHTVDLPIARYDQANRAALPELAGGVRPATEHESVIFKVV